MAKDAKDKTKKAGHEPDPVATALTAPDAPVGTAPEGAPTVPPAGPPERLTGARPAATRTTGATSAPASTTEDQGPGLADTAVSVASDVARVMQRVLPNRVPAYLGGTALLVLGVVDLPAALGGALAYEAIRRWRPAPSR